MSGCREWRLAPALGTQRAQGAFKAAWLTTLLLAACSQQAQPERLSPPPAPTLLTQALVAPAPQLCPNDQYCWYIPAPPVANAHANPSSYTLAFSVPSGSAAGTYSINGAAAVPFTVTSGTATELSITTASLALSAYGSAERKGIFVISDAQMSVSLYRPGSNSRDSVAAKEKTFALGQRFRLGGHTRNGANGNASGEGVDVAVVYAPQGGSITFTAPPGQSDGYWAGQAGTSFGVTLAPGESYGVRTVSDTCGQELDGALVTSDADITVVTGGRGFLRSACGTPNGTSGGCGDAGFDMPVPTEYLGTRHVVNDTGTAATSGEAVRVVADEDDTDIFLNGSGTAVANLDAGEFYTFRPGTDIADPTLIDSSKPVAVFQTAGAAGCELGMSYIPPLYLVDVAPSVSFTASASLSTNTVSLVIDSSDEASLLLDGGALAPDSSEAITGTSFKFLTKSVAAGAHTISAGGDFQLGLLSGNSNGTALYGYFSQYRRPDCGDGVLDSGEGCDDGNVDSFDGCDAACKVEPRYTCTGAPSACFERADACQQFGTAGVLVFGASDDAANGTIAGARAAGTTLLSNVFGANEIDVEVTVASAASTGSADALLPGASSTVSWRFLKTGDALEALVAGLRLVFDDFDPGELVTAIRAKRSDGTLLTVDLTDSARLTGDVAAGLSSSTAGGTVFVDFSDVMITGLEIDFGPTAPALRFVPGNALSPCLSSCGDGVLQGGEGCDDGGNMPGDGCNASCKIETGVACNTFAEGAVASASCESGICNLGSGLPGVCTAAGVCGNGALESGEGCDDGNTVAQDGCDAQCLREPGELCNTNPNGLTGDDSCVHDCSAGVCASGSSCGDGVVDAGEGCDTSGDSATCTAGCLIKSGNACGASGASSCDSGLCSTNGPAAGTCVDAGCGNGVVEAAEGCDEGADNGSGFCNPSCLIIEGGTCGTTLGALTGSASCDSGVCYTNAGTPGACVDAPAPAGACGNGVLEPGEACDDGTGPAGANTGSAACDLDCLITTGESCNFANPGLEGALGCASGICNVGTVPAVCAAANVCGNGALEAGNGEFCDDGNTDPGEGCQGACLIELSYPCADISACEPGAICDPVDGICEPVDTCGNGNREAGEGCDDGNTTPGDGCDSSCLLEDGEDCNALTPGVTGSASCQSGVCQSDVCVSSNTCGNGALEAGEGCDDGSGSPGGTGLGSALCTVDCRLKNGVPCNTDLAGVTGASSCVSGVCDATETTPTCEAVDSCGNSVVETGEGCDDGNTTPGDGCDSSCLLENGQACTMPASCASGQCLGATCLASNVCGNGVVESGEGCDNGTALSGGDASCNASCLVPNGVACGTAPAGLTGNASCVSGACDGGSCALCTDDVASGVDSGCTLAAPACSGGACVLCADTAATGQDDGCNGVTPICDTSGAPVCVGCLASSDCVGDAFCDPGTDTCIPDLTLTASAPTGTVNSRTVLPMGTTNAMDGTSVTVAITGDGLSLGCTATVTGGTWTCPAAITGLTPGVLYDYDISVSEGPQSESLDLDFGVNACAERAQGEACTDALVMPLFSGVCETAGGACVTCFDSLVAFGADAGCAAATPLCIGASCTPIDPDGDGFGEAADLDSDNDGIPDVDEYVGGLDATTDDGSNGVPDWRDPAGPSFVDSNGDGTDDRYDQDGDGVPNHLDRDSDNDGIADATEAGGEDADEDGVIDGFVDANTNGQSDALESAPLALPDTDGDGLPDFLDLDADGDGLTDALEAGETDADGDGLPDGAADADGDGVLDRSGSPLLLGAPRSTVPGGTPDYRNTDADGDGIDDLTEGHSPAVTPAGVDTDGDGLDDAFDPDCGCGAVTGQIATLPNSDSDPLPNYRDVDSDGDGIPDAVECSGGAPCVNTDAALSGGDTVPDYLDTDADGDSVPDSTEGFDVGRPGDAGAPDGLPDVLPSGTDTDGDGLDDAFDLDCIAAVCGGVVGVAALLPDSTEPDNGVPDYLDPDDDGDGIPTATEVTDGALHGADNDGDGTPAYLDTDADGDGADDGVEFGSDLNNDLVPDYLDVSSSPPDTDGDGVADYIECPAPGDPLTGLGCADTDGDGVADFEDPDDDNDGIGTAQELAEARDQDPDSPTFRDTDGDGLVDWLDLDSDSDGVPDIAEAGFAAADADGDGRADDATDGDGDGVLAVFDSDDSDAADNDLPSAPNSDGMGGIDSVDLDSDGDGLLDLREAATDTRDLGALDADGDGQLDDLADDDGDGLADLVDAVSQGGTGIEGEALAVPDTDGDGTPDFQDEDSDDDGVPDLVEANFDLGPPATTLMPSGNDSDGDGIDDSFDVDCASPGDCIDDRIGVTAVNADDDGDGLPRSRDVDDDNDGVLTADELGAGTLEGLDTDGDGVPDALDTDDDNDGISTADELAAVRALGALANAVPGDLDGDGLPAWRDTDSDGDGLLDAEEGLEDEDGDGVPDAFDPPEEEPSAAGMDPLAEDTVELGLSGGSFVDCSAGGSAGTTWLWFVLLALLLRRRRSQDGVLARLGFGLGRRSLVPAPSPTYLRPLRKGRLFRAPPRALRAWRWLLVLALFAALSAAAPAEAQRFELNRYTPAALPSDGFAVSRPSGLAHLKFAAQLQLNYADDPLVAEEVGASGTSELRAVVSDQLLAHALFALGLWDYATVFAGVPINLIMRGEQDAANLSASGAGLGDMRLGVRSQVYGDAASLFGLGVEGAVHLPTARLLDSDANFAGEQTVSGRVQALAELRLAFLRVALSFGAHFRRSSQVLLSEKGNELIFGVNVTAPLLRRAVHEVDLMGEFYGAAGFDGFLGREESPMELLGGGKYHYSALGIHAGAAAGFGLSRGLGAPDYRLVFMAGYTQPDAPPPPADRDGDGLLDPEDSCPDDPEDADAFEDEDGCPDPDNDDDGVLDEADGCPLDPEDADDFEDEDGCADPDNDKDGLLDEVDNCPVDAEDFDDYEDHDGCPDLDNDGDGILDADDRCPMSPEDKDGFEDEDGCLDPDNDNDAVFDEDDKCPNTPGEVKAEGCPVNVRVEAGRIRILKRVEFATNKATILPKSTPILVDVTSTIKSNPQLKRIRIEGHTDNVGREATNLTLSKKRAASVRRWLVDQGITAGRLEAYGCGEAQPIESNATKTGRRTNRRVEFRILGPDTPTETSCVPASP